MQIFLVATTHRLLALDDEDRVYRVHSGKGLYYGLASDQAGHLYVGCRNQVEAPEDDLARSRQDGSILVLDASSLAVVDELKPDFALRDLHGIACINDKLWVTCAYDNLVAVYDFQTHAWRKWYPASDPMARGRDINHLNTVTPFGDRICVVAHNNGPSHLLFYASPSLELCRAVALGSCAHDAFPVGADGIGTCSSGEGVLVSNTGWTLRTGGFPRGIAFGQDSVLLGISQLAPSAMRHQAASILRRFTPRWHQIADYDLGRVGMILAILPVNVDPNTVASLEPWFEVQRFIGIYSDREPGNIYRIGEQDGSDVFRPEWHLYEGTHGWTAAREARATVVINPGETKIIVKAMSLFPGAYWVEVCANRQTLGFMQWSQPGQSRAEFVLPGVEGVCELMFRVPHLWQPSRYGSEDERMLGIGIIDVHICQ